MPWHAPLISAPVRQRPGSSESVKPGPHSKLQASQSDIVRHKYMNFTSFFLELVSVAWEQGTHTHCSTCVWSDLCLTLIYIHTYTDIDTHTDIHTQRHTQIETYMHTQTYTHTLDTGTQNIYTHTYRDIHRYTHMHNMDTQTHRQTHIHIETHTNRHITRHKLLLSPVVYRGLAGTPVGGQAVTSAVQCSHFPEVPN